MFFTVTELTECGDIIPFRRIYRSVDDAKKAAAETFYELYEEVGVGGSEVEIIWSQEGDECWNGWLDGDLFVIQQVTIDE